MRRYLGSLLILAVILAACVPVPAAPTIPESRGLQPTEVNSLRVRQTLDVTGATTLAALAPSSLTVSGATALNGGLTLDTTAFTVADTSGNVATAGTLSVGGGFGSTGCSISAAGVVQCDGAVTLGSTLAVTGALTANGGIAVDTSAFTVADTSGNTAIAGTLAITGATTIVGLVNANGGIAVDTSAFTVADITGNTVISGTLKVGGLRTVWGSDTITATASITHGLATPQYAFCTLGEDTSAAKAICTVLISGATVTAKVWKADGTTAGDAGTLVYWQVVGAP